MSKPNEFFPVREFDYVTLGIDGKGQFWLYWELSYHQQRFLNSKISPFTCWKKERLCEKQLRRPHLTCFTCKLRLVVSGKDPRYQPITIHQIWLRKDRSQNRKILAKIFLSITEALG